MFSLAMCGIYTELRFSGTSPFGLVWKQQKEIAVFGRLNLSQCRQEGTVTGCLDCTIRGCSELGDSACSRKGCCSNSRAVAL